MMFMSNFWGALHKTLARAHKSATDALLHGIRVLYPHLQDTPRARQCALHTRRTQYRVRYPLIKTRHRAHESATDTLLRRIHVLVLQWSEG